MRLLFVLILGGFVGWIVGGLYPAPHAWLAWINGAIEQGFSDVGNQQTTTAVTAPSAAPTPSAAPASSVAPATSAPPTSPAASASSAAPASSAPAPSRQSAARRASTGAVDEQTLNQYRSWIHEARQTYPYFASEERMYALMMCESRGRAGLVNPAGPYSGLFQYGSATWRGAWNTYRDQSILDPRAQIFATALAWQLHMQGQWGACYTNFQ